METVQDCTATHLDEIEELLSDEEKSAFNQETLRICGNSYLKMSMFRREWLLAYERLVLKGSN